MMEKITQVASTAVEALKGQPLMLAMVILNTLFLALIVFFLMQISSAGQRRDTLITTLFQSCFQQLNR